MVIVGVKNHISIPVINCLWKISVRSKMMNYPAAERNKDPILHVLRQIIPLSSNHSKPLFALELGSGSGQHVVYFAKHFGNVLWQPSDVTERCLNSISAHIAASGVVNVYPPLYINCEQEVDKWANGNLQPAFYDYILSVNMIHITPWSCTVGLFRGAGALLKTWGLLITYGAYAVHGKLFPESNVHFDHSLRQQDPEFGIRDVDDLMRLAAENSMTLEQVIDMPANNKTLIFRKQPPSD